MKAIDPTLSKLAELVTQGRYEALETEALEIKSVPPDTGSWRELHRVVSAFLNTRGGIIILGVIQLGAAETLKADMENADYLKTHLR